MADFQNIGAFVPTTNIWDVQQLYSVDVNTPEFKELLVRLYQNINNIALVLNIKDSGYYPLEEFLNGKLFFPNPNLTPNSFTTASPRQEFRMTVNFGSLPNNTTKSVPHGIMFNESYIGTSFIGSATQSTPVGGSAVAFQMIPIPYASSTGDNVEVWADNINVNIRTASSTYVDFTNSVIVLSYLKN